MHTKNDKALKAAQTRYKHTLIIRYSIYQPSTQATMYMSIDRQLGNRQLNEWLTN